MKRLGLLFAVALLCTASLPAQTWRQDACTTADNTSLGNGWTMNHCQGIGDNSSPPDPTSASLTTTNSVGVGHWLIAAIQEAGSVGEYLYASDSLGNVAAGYVTTNGTAVTFSSGLPFSLAGCSSISGSRCYWNGKTIKINGTNYTISTVNSITSITLATSAGVQSTPVPYTGSGWWCSDTDGDVQSSVQAMCVAYVSTGGTDTITATCSPGAYHCGGADQYVMILNTTEIFNTNGVGSLDYAACALTGCAVKGGVGTGQVQTTGSNPSIASQAITPSKPGELIFLEAGYGVGPVWPPEQITGASWTSGTATLMVGANALASGSAITVSGMNPSGYNGSFTLSGESGTSVSYSVATNPGPYVSPGSVSSPGWFGLINGTEGSSSSNGVCQGNSSTGYCTNEANTQVITRSASGSYTADQDDGATADYYVMQVVAFQPGSASLVSIAVTPANGSIAKGTTQQFTATGTYSDNSTQNLTGSVTWASTNTAVATITSGGLATGVTTGSTTIQATSGSISGSTGATVTSPTLVSIAVTPANPSIASGTTQQFTATGTYSDTSTQNLTSSVTWSSSSTAAATIASGGLATGVATGVSTIQATLGSISGSTSLTVTSVLVSITVTPANASLAKGATQQYAATGLFSDNGTLNLTSSVTWTSTNPAAATIASGGLATGVAAGSTTIQAALGGTSGSTGLTVTPPALVSIAVTPANSSLTIGATQQFTATGTYSDNSTQNLTSSATWTSTNTAVATITSGGLATGVAAGSTTIQATSGSITGSTGLTVTPSNLVGWWTFNDGSGATAADSSGNGLTASLVNGVSWVTGKLGDAISANGVNQYGTVPAINLSSTKSVTVAMWLNRTYSTRGGHALLEFSSNYNNSTTGFGFFPDDSSCGGIQAAVHGAVGYSVGCYKQPTSGVWHHIAIVYDKTQAGSNAVNLYIDGVLQTATSRPYTSTNTDSFGSNPLYFFSRGGTQENTAGEMDDLRLYNRALSAAEVMQLYQAGEQ